jgi:hypothetical protein
MKDTIRKFRKVTGILIEEKGYTGTKIYKEMNISEPTLAKLLKEDIEEIKIKASVLAAVQDFNKRHIEDLNYAGIDPGDAEESRGDPPAGKRKYERKTPIKKQEETVTAEETRQEPTPEPLPQKPAVDEDKGLFAKKDFIEMLAKVARELPSNVVINITINEK